MRFRATFAIPEEVTAGALHDVMEMLHGHGYAEASLQGRSITFEWEAADADPAPVSQMVVDVAVEEAKRLSARANEDVLRQVLAQAVGAMERWQEVVDELRSYGFRTHDIEPQRVPA